MGAQARRRVGASEDELVARRARVADASARLATARERYFRPGAGDPERATKFHAAGAELVAALLALRDARIEAAVRGDWVARPELYRPAPETVI